MTDPVNPALAPASAAPAAAPAAQVPQPRSSQAGIDEIVTKKGSGQGRCCCGVRPRQLRKRNHHLGSGDGGVHEP